MKTIETANPHEIIAYLDYLEDKASNIGNGDPYNGVWEQLYDMVFSEDISAKICKRFPNFKPYIPNTDYHSDVTSYIHEFRYYIECYQLSPSELPSFEEYINCKENKDL